MIEISPGVSISEQEVRFSFERSPGPGGQYVNKANTRVTLQFDVDASLSLSNVQKGKVKKKLGSRINNQGVLRIVSSKERTQLANRRAAVNRLIELMSDAFKEQKPRKKTKPPASADRKRLETKAKRSAVKLTRQAKVAVED